MSKFEMRALITLGIVFAAILLFMMSSCKKEDVCETCMIADMKGYNTGKFETVCGSEKKRAAEKKSLEIEGKYAKGCR